MSYLLGQFGTVRSVSCLSISGCFCPVQSNLSKATSDLAAGQRTLVKHQHSSNPSHASSSKLSTHASFTFTLFKLTLVFQVDVAESPLIYIYIIFLGLACIVPNLMIGSTSSVVRSLSQLPKNPDRLSWFTSSIRQMLAEGR
jgi:hypothetical protein